LGEKRKIIQEKTLVWVQGHISKVWGVFDSLLDSNRKKKRKKEILFFFCYFFGMNPSLCMNARKCKRLKNLPTENLSNLCTNTTIDML
jgi:hypothetical protein